VARRVVALIVVAACGGDADSPMPDAATGTPSIAGTPVSSFETSSCATSVVLPLSIQIADEVNCMMPGQLVAFDEGPAIMFSGSAVLPYVSSAARDALVAATTSSGNVLQVTSAFRTVVQQYLLYRWFQMGRCGITAAADPGTSNHESGRALDVSNYSTWITALEANGWAHDVPGDPVHFDHLSSPDIRGADVLAFQRLWNRNAPDDQIAEDGQYGPMTEERIKRAPAEGFGIGALCAQRLMPPIAREGQEVECAR